MTHYPILNSQKSGHSEPLKSPSTNTHMKKKNQNNKHQNKHRSLNLVSHKEKKKAGKAVRGILNTSLTSFLHSCSVGFVLYLIIRETVVFGSLLGVLKMVINVLFE